MSKVALRVYNHEIESLIEQGHVDEAIAHCQHILKTYPKHLETYRLLGKAYLEAHRHNDAADIFQRVLTSVPDDFVSHLGMSIINDEQKNLDQATWHMERDPALRSTVVAVTWLDKAPDWDVLQKRVDRMSRSMPGMRQIVVQTPVPLSTPRLVVDQHFDLSWHLRRVRLAESRDQEAALELARRAAMDAFDRDRPLWEFTLIEGLEDGRAAFLVKLHHSLADGVGGMRMLGVLFDLQREPSELGPLPPAPIGEESSALGLAAQAVGSMVSGSARIVRQGAERALPAAWHGVRSPVRAAKETTALARSIYRTAGPMFETRSPVMRERAMTRHVAMLELPLSDLKHAAETVDSTVNVAFLAAITGGLRAYHHEHGAPVESLRVTMPVNLRTKDDSDWGNRITLQRLTLPVEEADPAERMRQIHRITRKIHDDPALPATDLIAGALNLLPPAYVGGVLKHVDFLASNVPGSPIPIYLAGAEVTGFYAFGPTIGASLNLTLMSYQQVCNIGINIDTAAVTDPDVLLDCLRQGFAEISAL